MATDQEAVEYAGDLLSYVYGETSGRWQAKSKGKGKKGKGKGRGKENGKGPRGFGVYGTYADHRKALQDARTARGFTNGGKGEPRPSRTSIQDLKSRSRCHQCHQVGHWSRECPQRRRHLGQALRPLGQMHLRQTCSLSTSQLSSTAMMASTSGARRLGVARCSPPLFRRPTLPQFLRSWFRSRFSRQARSTAQLQERAGIQSTELFFTAEEYMCSAFLSFTFASSSEEPPGSALIDTAAQRGLIGAETLAKLDSHLQKNYKLRVQYTQEEGGTVRGVCGSEQVTRIAFVPISLGGRQEFFVFRWFQERFHV